MHKNLIIYTHLYEKSLNKAILDTVVQGLQEAERDYIIIDLHKSGFDPRFNLTDLELYSKGETSDPLVIEYIQLLKWADNVIMIYPIWWSDMPANLKGFFDKVMLLGHTYAYDENDNLVGKLTNIKKAVAITTSGSPTDYIQAHCGNPVQGVHLDTIWKQLGVDNNLWLNCGGQDLLENERRVAFLESVTQHIKTKKI